MNSGKLYAEQMVTAHRHFQEQGHKVMNDLLPVYEFVLANGVEYNGTAWTKFRGRGYRKMELRRCFANAWYASYIIPELTYCEGFAYAGLISVHHAWCIDELGRVVDFTWRKAHHDLPESEWEYFGICFDTVALGKWWNEKGTASVLFDLDYNGDPTEHVIQAAA
jgi:hypothetical protein